MREALEHAKTQPMVLQMTDEKGKKNGSIFLQNCSLRNYYTFLDLVIKNDLNIVPIIAVDFSLANLTFDENQYCIHSLKSGA